MLNPCREHTLCLIFRIVLMAFVSTFSSSKASSQLTHSPSIITLRKSQKECYFVLVSKQDIIFFTNGSLMSFECSCISSLSQRARKSLTLSPEFRIQSLSFSNSSFIIQTWLSFFSLKSLKLNYSCSISSQEFSGEGRIPLRRVVAGSSKLGDLN